MIQGKREITTKVFMEKIFPHSGVSKDSLLSDFNLAIAEKKPYVLIFRDYNISVPWEDIKAHLEKEGGLAVAGKDIEPIDAFLPKNDDVPAAPADSEARAIEAKHPKPVKSEFPSFKPGKRAPLAPELPEE